MTSRRSFLKFSGAVSLAFAGQGLFASFDPNDPDNALGKHGYGPLIKDPEGVLDLPKGFSYKVISRKGDPMADGYLVPSRPDGMATFQDGDVTIIMRNHEASFHEDGPYGKNFKLFKNMDKGKVYDICNDGRPCTGGVSKILYDTKKQEVISQSLALTGTLMNCAGGATPWGTWITCEETVSRSNTVAYKERRYSRDHGYVFEVPANTKMELTKPVPLKALGRFRHEAVGVDPRTSIVYLTEDRGNGLLYRFLPNEKENMLKGGQLQALMIEGKPKFETTNWDANKNVMLKNQKFRTRWVNIDNVEAPMDDLRSRGKRKGAAMFARGEGMYFGDNELYVACTAGGAKRLGQIFKYVPAADEGAGDKRDRGGDIELFFESLDERDMRYCDNVTVCPWGDLMACEDSDSDEVRLIAVTPAGKPYTFASHHQKNEFTGVTFSPDGTTLFVNIQSPGLTIAVTGPWRP